MSLKCITKIGLAILLAFSVSFALANVAPVEDLTHANTEQASESSADSQSYANYDASPTQQASAQDDNAAPSDRIARLEQQMANITQMNLPAQISELRQEIQQLNGRIQEQQHDIKVLGQQQKNFYQDLNHRVEQLIGGDAKQSASAQSPRSATASSATDASSYRAAFSMLIKKQYPAAIDRFNAYIENYPKGAFLANAHYWLGEIYLKKNNKTQAQKAFNAVIAQFPKSNKVPDAKLKLAVMMVNSGKTAEGRQALQAVKNQYPGSTAAQLASIQLQRLEQ